MRTHLIRLSVYHTYLCGNLEKNVSMYTILTGGVIGEGGGVWLGEPVGVKNNSELERECGFWDCGIESWVVVLATASITTGVSRGLISDFWIWVGGCLRWKGTCNGDEGCSSVGVVLLRGLEDREGSLLVETPPFVVRGE